MLRSLSISLILLVLVPCGAGAQTMEVGPAVSDLGPGITVSVPVAEAWSVRIHGSYAKRSRTAIRSFGGLSLTTLERRTVGSVGVTADWRPGSIIGASLGAWVLVANTRFESRASNAVLLGTSVEPGEIGELHAEASLPQRPSVYLGLHAVSPLAGCWSVRADIGAVIGGQTRQAESADGRLAGSSYWGRAPSPSRIVPAAQIGLIYSLRRSTP